MQLLLLFIFPLFGSVACSLVGMYNRKLLVIPLRSCPWLVSDLGWGGNHASGGCFSKCKFLGILWLDLGSSSPEGSGLNSVADLLGALIALVVLGVEAFIVSIYAKLPVEKETPKGIFILYLIFYCKLPD